MTATRRGMLAMAALAGATGPARAAWPERPVTIISPFGPGSLPDIVGRLVAPGLSRVWGQPVVVQNLPGAAGVIGVERVARSAPDGLTIGFSADAALVVRVSMDPKPPYDPQVDLAPVTQIGRTPNVLVIGRDVPYASLADLLAAAKARPGSVSFAHIGNGTSQHIGGELLAQRAGVELTAVAYNDGGAQLQDVLAGRATMTFINTVTALPRLQDGSFRALGVSSATRIAAAPQIPTIAEQGFPGFDAVAWLGVVLRAGTPAEILGRIHRDVLAALADADVAPRLVELGIEPVRSSPAEFAALIRAEIPRMAGVLERAGLRAR